MIFMLHSVGNTHTNWIYNFLSIKLKHIENFFIFLKHNKIDSFFVKDLYDTDFVLPANSIALTFDDGYVDNWVYLFPLLEKYELKATLFVNPEFIDYRDTIREKFISGISGDDKDKTLGFLSWNEMIEMEKSGLVDIQSHSMSHTWYFTEPELIDFYFSSFEHEIKFPWISWNEKPEQKPFTHNSYAFKSRKFGTPVFKYGRSLGIRKFIPDEDIINYMVKFTRNNPETLAGDGKKILFDKFKEISTGKKELGRFETDTEMKERYWYELYQSKHILEKKLNKEINILCWPGGIYNKTSLELSEECGYIASTIWSKDRSIIDNRSKKYKRIKRIPMSGNISVRGKNFGPSYLKNFLIHENYPKPIISKTLIKAEKIFRLIVNR